MVVEGLWFEKKNNREKTKQYMNTFLCCFTMLFQFCFSLLKINVTVIIKRVNIFYPLQNRRVLFYLL
jgi:hypothetical protein